MEFRIRRTSTFDDTIQPHPSAYRKAFTRIDERTVSSPGNNPYLKDWFDYGENHRVEHGHMKRDFEDNGWFVTIDDLPHLLEFIRLNGDIVLGSDFENPDIIELEIYDGYRE